MPTMTIRWKVKERAEARGWENAQQFSVGAGLTYPTAARVLAGEPLERIEVATLEKLTTVFGLKTPWALLEYTED
jgi:hypothetical protein